MKRLVALTCLVAITSLGLAGPVAAAAPGNDTYATREVIASIPFSTALDTSEATTDALDGEANAECGAPATDASVWYEFVPEVDGQIRIVAEADYAAGIIVLRGTPGAFALDACGPFEVSAPASAGDALTILVFDYDGEGNGGTLDLIISEAPPPPVLDLTVNAAGSVNARTGVATVRGTITCSGEGVGDAFIDVFLTQSVGRFKVEAGGGTGFTCDGSTEAWAVELVGYNGRLAGGRANVMVIAFACSFDCTQAVVERVITLRR